MAISLPSWKPGSGARADDARGTSLWSWMLGDTEHRCPRCVQPLPRRWWQEMQGRHYRCACGAILTTRLSTAWDWPLVFAGAMGVGFGLNFVDLTALESGFAAATLAAVIGWLDRFLFGQPQRAPVGRSLSG